MANYGVLFLAREDRPDRLGEIVAIKDTLQIWGRREKPPKFVCTIMLDVPDSVDLMEMYDTGETEMKNTEDGPVEVPIMRKRYWLKADKVAELRDIGGVQNIDFATDIEDRAA